ncbi:hypothetical protein HF086_015020 [Spodoptera exigua]|uniref:Uncharacterized protein n=1 Tax=Spodoptera exigua TaxID=7107 RepID=A0A922M778_SPOEX|nr:hypothetical protein HF086_015020 [Spodoptera exigua]
MADKMLEQLHHQISAVHNTSSPSPPAQSTPSMATNHENALLHAKIDMLAKEIAELKTHHSYGRQRGRNWRGARHRSRSSNRSPHGNRRPDSNHRAEYNDKSVCYFHRRFGEQARKCTRPCTYEDKPLSTSGN